MIPAKPTICFGEILGRFSPPGHLRLAQAMPGVFDVAFAGAEANVAVAIAQLGGSAEFVSALPCNSIADAAVSAVRAAGAGAKWVIQKDVGRCGLYFVEAGASQRGGSVQYDREYSAFSLCGYGEYRWDEIFRAAGWFHTSGVTAGVSAIAAETAHSALIAARRSGIPTSFDLNFRRKLWRWNAAISPEELARGTMKTLSTSVDVLIGNPFDLALVTGTEFTGDPADLAVSVALARQVGHALPHLKWVAMTLRQNHSASRNLWGALLYRPADGAFFAAPQSAAGYAPYIIDTIVDRVGTGDAFAGGLIHAFQSPELADPCRAIAFATAAGCLAHSIKGDFFYCSRREVEALMGGNANGHFSR